MLNLKTRRGLSVCVPEIDADDPSPKFDISDAVGIKKYYEDNGYVVIKELFPDVVCNETRKLWDDEIKTHPGFIYRQASAVPEKNILNSKNWVMNPILNLQSIDPRKFPRFRKHSTEKILASAELTQAFSTLFNEPPRIVQSMYFEGNTATSEHQDSFYLDSNKIGTLAAAWVALEDISATAGRFFVCPRSHKAEYIAHTPGNSIVGDYESYFVSIIKKVESQRMEIRAPKLNRGDVLLWNSLTIHGSLDSHDPNNSRSSITCHAIAKSHRFLQLHARIHDMQTDVVGGVEVGRPKDLARMRNRIVFAAEAHFPNAFAWIKKQAIKHLLRRKAAH